MGAKLSTTLSLVDGFSSKLNSVNNSLQKTSSSMDKFRNMMNKPMGSGLFSSLTGGIKTADSAMSSFSASAAAKIGAISGVVQSLTTTGINVLSNGIREMVGELSSASATWQTFEGNMAIMGKGASEIKAVKAELQDFATKTIYSASDMSSTYSQLAAVGTKNTTQLVEGFGGLAAAAEDPAQAMKTLSQQATQMAALPKVQWMDFKLMLQQTPAGMAAVAKQMGKSTEQLVKDIQDGKVATQDFFDAISKVGGDTNGDFYKMATKFKTIGQAMDGLKEGLTNKLQPAFDKASQVGIRMVTNLGGKLENMIDPAKLSAMIDKFAPKLEAGIGKTVKFLKNSFNTAKTAAQQFFSGFKSTGALNAAKAAFESIGQAIGNVKNALLKGGASSQIASLGQALGSITKGAANVIKSISDAIAGMSAGQINVVVTGLKAVAVAMMGFKVASVAFRQGLAVYQGISVAVTAIKALSSAFKGLPKTPQGGGAPAPALPPAPSVGNSAAGWMNAAKTATVLLGVAVSIKLVASAFSEISTVNVSWGQIGKNLAQMGVFLLATAAAMGIIGGALQLFPPIAIALAIGAAIFIVIAGTMATVGESLAIFGESTARAVKAVNSIKIDNNFSSKLLELLGALSELTGVAAFTGILGTIAGPFAIIGAINFSLIAVSITKIAEFAQKISGMTVPPVGAIKPKLRQVQDIAKALSEFKLGSVGDIGAVFSSAFASLTTGNIVGTFKKVADFVQQINSMPAIDSTVIQNKFNQIKKIKDALTKAEDGMKGNPIDNAFNSWFESMDTGNIVKSFQKVTDLVTKISSLPQIDSKTLDSKFAIIKDVFNKIKDFSSENFGNSIWDSLNSVFGKMDTSNLVSSFTKVADLTSKISGLKVIDSGTIDSKFKSIKDVFAKLRNFKLDSYKGDISSLDSYKKITEAINKISGFVSDLAGTNIVDISGKLEQLKNTVEQLSKFKIKAPQSDLQASLDNVNKVVKPLSEIATALGSIASIADLSQVEAKVDQIKTAVNKIAGLTINQAASGLADSMNAMKPIIANVTAIAQSLQALNGIVIDVPTILANINAIKAIFSNGVLSALSASLSTVSGLEASFATAKTSLSSLSGMVSTLNGIPTVSETISANVVNIQKALDSLSQLTVSGNISGQLDAVTTSVKQTLDAINRFATETSTAGTTAGQGFASGLKSGFSQALSFATQVSSQITGALSGVAGQMYGIGLNIGQGLANGMNASRGAVTAAASALAAQADKAARAKAEVHSPSRVFMATGQFFGQGLAIGMQKQYDNVANAGAGLFDVAYNGNNDVPSQPLETSPVSTTNSTSKSENNFNFGDIIIQSSGDAKVDAEELLGEVEYLLQQKYNANLSN